MPIEILLIVVLILFLISIVLNIFTYFKIEKEKNLILKELSNNSNIISQIVLNIQQIQKGLNNVEDNLDKIKSTFKNSLESSFLELDNKLTEIKRQTYNNFQHFETLINENKNEFKTELSKLHNDILINIESKYKSMDEKMIENKDRMEYAINLLIKTGSILKEFETLLVNKMKEYEKEITDLTQSKYEELLKEVEENYKKIQELEKKIEHIIKLLKEPLTEEDLR
jgi:biopolymer transport protein ExbB/TolQ